MRVTCEKLISPIGCLVIPPSHCAAPSHCAEAQGAKDASWFWPNPCPRIRRTTSRRSAAQWTTAPSIPHPKLEAAGYPDADAFASDTCGSKRLIASNAVTYSPESDNSK